MLFVYWTESFFLHLQTNQVTNCNSYKLVDFEVVTSLANMFTTSFLSYWSNNRLSMTNWRNQHLNVIDAPGCKFTSNRNTNVSSIKFSLFNVTFKVIFFSAMMTRMRQQMESLFRRLPGQRGNETDGFQIPDGPVGFLPDVNPFGNIDLGKGNTTSVTKVYL